MIRQLLGRAGRDKFLSFGLDLCARRVEHRLLERIHHRRMVIVLDIMLEGIDCLAWSGRGGILGEQGQGTPLQKATFGLTVAPPRGFTFSTELVYDGSYNELFQPPFVTAT